MQRMSGNRRSGMGGPGDYGRMRGYDGPGGGGGYNSRGRQGGLLDSGLGGGGGGGGYDMDNLLHQRSLQQQLSLRESQLALANSLLQQQQSYLMEGPSMGMRGGPGALGPGPPGAGPLGMEPRGLMMHKRRMDMRPGDFGPEFKRPRNDFSPRPRDRYRSRDSDDGNRSSQSRRSQSSGRSYSGRSRGSSDKYDPEDPTNDDDEKEGGAEKGKKTEDPFHCHVCNVNCRDNDGFRRHMNSMRHNDRMMGMLAVHEEKASQLMGRVKAEKHLRHVEDDDKATRGFCKICDMALKVRYADHQAMTFHRKRVKQVTKGCGWCGVPSFKNFTQVLAHRETEEHKKNQEKYEKEEKKEGDGSGKRAPIRVEIPAELARYNADTTYGQMCVIPVTGWFCKLCNKFFNNESAAKDAHCKAEDHYVKYKRFVYTKLRAKAEAERAKEEEEEKERKREDGEGKMSDEEAGEEEEEKEAAKGEREEETGEGREEEEDREEERMEEEEEAMLSMDGMAGEYLDDDDDDEGRLLQDTKEASDYLTADDTTVMDRGGEEGEGESSAISLMAGESGSEFLNSDSITADVGVVGGDSQEEEEEESLEGDGEDNHHHPPTRATRAAVNTSTPIQGHGASAPKARRGGRKAAK